ncbi:MAG: DUF2252 domain-containing protein [Terriglobia bacterium]
MAAKTNLLKALQLSTKVLSREERKASGKSLREKIPRKSQGEWNAPSHRRDPVDVLIESSKGRVPHLVPIRYGRMMQSPFAFFRGAAAIMAADLANTPTSGIRVQACGDCHLLNFGGFGTPERRIIFDINDFDETLPAPWEWDVKRLAASFVIAGQNNGFTKAEARECAARCVQSYREHMQSYAEMGVLEMWYERIDHENLLALIQSKEWRKRVQRRIAKESSRSVVDDDFPKLAIVKNGKPEIKDNPPLIFHQSRLELVKYDANVKEAFRRYRETLSDDLKALLDRYEIKDVALKVVGVGSVGTRCAILLLMASDGEPLFLQVKEARASVLEPYAGNSVYPNRGQRVVAGQKIMQSASDMFLGWTEEGGHHYYIRQLRDIKIKTVVEILDPAALKSYADWCGWALAQAHAKSGDAATISGYLGKGTIFDEAIANFAVSYADQNEQDHQALLNAIRDGKIEIFQE